MSAHTAEIGSTREHERLPRKARIATCIFPHYGEFPGIEKRLADIKVLFDKMISASKKQYHGAVPDLLLLPEHAVTGGGRSGTANNAADKATAYTGPIEDFFSSYAKAHGCYIAVPMHEQRGDACYNSIILVDRSGERAGCYDKCFPVVDETWHGLEDGISPGKELPVFDCDFGRLGLQICFDMSNAAAWQQLEDADVDLVAWCTASPQTILPQARALQHGFWIVTATMRNNASVIQPHTGFIHQQITEANAVLVSEIDLNPLHLLWMPALRNGTVFTERFGDNVGFSYSEREDNGLFWSNDPNTSIDAMADELGLLERAKRVQRSHELNPYWK